MPSSLQHTDQAQHNLDFLKLAYESRVYNDWCVTVGFYAAVHIIEYAIYASTGFQYKGIPLKRKLLSSGQLPEVAGAEGIPKPENISWNVATPHQLRNILVRDNFPEIEKEYLLLYRKSRSSRYECYQFSKEDVDSIVKDSLQKIISWSNEKFGTSFTLDLK